MQEQHQILRTKSFGSVSRFGYIFAQSIVPFKLAAYINGRLSAYDFPKAEYSRRLQVRTLQWSPTSLFFCPCHRRGDTQLLAGVGQACHVGTPCARTPAHPQFRVSKDTHVIGSLYRRRACPASPQQYSSSFPSLVAPMHSALACRRAQNPARRYECEPRAPTVVKRAAWTGNLAQMQSGKRMLRLVTVMWHERECCLPLRPAHLPVGLSAAACDDGSARAACAVDAVSRTSGTAAKRVQ